MTIWRAALSALGLASALVAGAAVAGDGPVYEFPAKKYLQYDGATSVRPLPQDQALPVVVLPRKAVDKDAPLPLLNELKGLTVSAESAKTPVQTGPKAGAKPKP